MIKGCMICGYVYLYSTNRPDIKYSQFCFQSYGKSWPIEKAVAYVEMCNREISFQEYEKIRKELK